MRPKETERRYNPWKIAMISLGVSIAVLVAAVLVVAAINVGRFGW